MTSTREAKSIVLVAAAPALLADPYLYRHMKDGVRGPECNYCNACYARASVLPTDCYDPAVRAEKDLVLRPGNG